MSSPTARQSVDGATSTGSGSDVASLGHSHIGLFVATDTAPTSLTVQLEVSPDETNWAVAQHVSGTIEITESDLNSNNNAHVAAPGIFGYAYRANVTAYDAAGNVDAYVLAAGNAGQGRQPVSRDGPVSNH